MIQNSKIQNSSEGMTIIEIVVVISIITILSVILISDFPKINRQYALSGAVYKLAQDTRKAQDLGLSGVQIKDSQNNPIAATGYGIYINLQSSTNTKYIIYADVRPNSTASGNNVYDGDFSTTPLCSSAASPTADCIVEIIDISKQNSGLIINGLTNVSGNITSINFSPPNPIINIENLNTGSSEIGIVLGLKSESSNRTVRINTSGLISVQ